MRSDTVKKGFDKAPHRALLRATGLKDEDFGKPFVAIVNSYGVDVVVDMELFMQPDVYFEAGDHEDLIHVSAENFQKLMSSAEHASFSKPV